MFLRGRGDKGACAIDIINAGIVLTSNMALDVLQELKKAKLVEELPARDEEERKFSGYRRWRAVDQLTKSKKKNRARAAKSLVSIGSTSAEDNDVHRVG
jgi:hypothetical protein